MLCKSKSASYILKRAFREKWKGNPINIFSSYPERVAETADYHGLGTAAAIDFTEQLLRFGIWMAVTKGYPAAALDHQQVKVTRGVLPNGFNNYWQEFLKETDTLEITFTPSDFGSL